MPTYISPWRPTAVTPATPDYQVQGRIKMGARYAFRRGDGHYRVTGFPIDPHSRQVRCLYLGLGGRDDGVSFVCTLNDFTFNFVEVPEEPEVAEPPPEGKTAGRVNTGSGA